MDDDLFLSTMEQILTFTIHGLSDKLGYAWSSVQEHLKKIGKTWRRGIWVSHTCDELLEFNSKTPFLQHVIKGDENCELYANQGSKRQRLSTDQVAKSTPRPGLTTKKTFCLFGWTPRALFIQKH